MPDLFAEVFAGVLVSAFWFLLIGGVVAFVGLVVYDALRARGGRDRA